MIGLINLARSLMFGSENEPNVKKRRYDAASQSTRTKNWYTQSTDANGAIVRPSLIRNRARDLVRNNPWAAKGVSVIVNNAIGYGIRAQWDGKTKKAKSAAQSMWEQWSESLQCDANGLNDLYGLQQLAFRCTVESGEALVRLRPRVTESGVPFQVQILEPDFIYDHTAHLDNGGWVANGIEYDKTGKRVAYYLYKYHPGSTLQFVRGSGNVYERVPAYEIIHLFRIDRPGQERGVSWLAPVIIRLRELDIYEDAYLKRQQIANLFAGFIRTDNPDEDDIIDDDSELTPGSMHKLKFGEAIDFSNPPKADDYGPFTLDHQRAVASGLNITYEALTGDLSQVNFSSARMGWQEFGRSVDAWQWQLFIPRFCHGVAQWFIDMTGIPGLSHGWTPPARTMVDPAREVPAIKDSIRTGLKTISEAIREQGYDPRTMLTEMANDYAMLDELGLVLDCDGRKTTTNGLNQSDPNQQNLEATNANTNTTDS